MILVTGCSGFIGFHLAKKLLEKKKSILGIDIIDNYYSKSKKIQRLNIIKKFDNFNFLKVDLNNFDKLRKIINKYPIDTIIHLAAQPGVRISLSNPFNTLKQNLTAFINVLEIARLKKVKKFIYASSSSVYGNSKIYPFNEQDFENIPVSVYGSTKLSNEIIADAYSRNFNINSIGLRFFTVYGPHGRPDMAYYSFLDNLRKNLPIQVFNKGNMMRDFTYIDDVVLGIVKVIKTKFKKKHEILNIGKGKPDKLMDLIKYLEKFYKKKFKIKFTKNIPIGDIKNTFSNTSKAKKIIKWIPKVNLENGIEKFVKWYKLDNGIK